MPSRRSLIASLILFAFGLVASGCNDQVQISPEFPPAADLKVEPKPVPGVDIVTSAAASAEYDVAVESWGQRGWNAVGRICRWAKDLGAPGIDCPP